PGLTMRARRAGSRDPGAVSARRSSGPGRGAGDRELRERWQRAEIVASESPGGLQVTAGERVRLDAARLRIDDPVVRHAVPRVEMQARAAVESIRRIRPGLDRESRRALHFAGASEPRAAVFKVRDVL